MRSKLMFAAAFFCLLAMFPRNASGQGFNVATVTESLKLTSRFTVVIDDIPPALANRLDADTLQTAIELRLRQTGITVLNVNENNGEFQPQLQVHCHVVRLPDRNFVYNVDVSYQRYLKITIFGKDEVKFIRATLWQRASGGIATASDVASDIRKQIDDGVSAFLNLYLAANPKP